MGSKRRFRRSAGLGVNDGSLERLEKLVKSIETYQQTREGETELTALLKEFGATNEYIRKQLKRCSK
jgi:hypothetical protein